MSKPATLSTVEVRKQNRNRVYRHLISLPEPITKQDLAQQLSMSLPTLTQNMKELAQAGLIGSTGTTDSTGGRRPKLIAAIPDARYAVGIELTSGHIRMVAVDIQQNELAFQVLNQSFENSEEYARRLVSLLEHFLSEHELKADRLLGVGLTLPGIISADQSTIEYAPTMGIREPTQNRITAPFSYPHRLDNDATCGGFGEWWNKPNRENMAYLSLGRGVGGALLIGGRLYAGESHRSAEFGHMCIHPGGRLCDCGRRGCLEAYCSSARLSTDLDLTLDEFFAELQKGNESYQRRWEEYLNDLAAALSNIHIMLDCDVVIGGSVSQYLPEYEERLRSKIQAQDPISNHGEYFHFCRNHSKTNCVGAAVRFISDFIETV